MIRYLSNGEIVKLSKERMDHPFKLLWFWLFGVNNVANDFEYIMGIEDANWRIVGIKVLFAIPIYVMAWTYKIIDFLIPFCDLEYLFEVICCTIILIIFGVIRLPYAIYTYMRFNRATALMYMIKSD